MKAVKGKIIVKTNDSCHEQVFDCPDVILMQVLLLINNWEDSLQLTVNEYKKYQQELNKVEDI